MKHYQSRLLKALFTLACLTALQTITAQWPQWRGPNRDGFCNETNLLKSWPAEGPKLLWATDSIMGDGFSSAIIQDKTIYTTGKKDSVEVITALDLTGKVIWQKEIGKASKNDWPESRSTPTIFKGKLYSVTVLGEISCVDSKTGTIDWKISIPKKFEAISVGGSDFCESPLVADDKVFITPCGKNTTMVALNGSTGETIWKSESIKDTNFFVSPVLIQRNEKKMIVTSTKNTILAIDATTGKIIWTEKVSSGGFVPVPLGKQVYFSGRNCGKMFSMNDDMNSADILWRDTLKISNLAGAVHLGNKLYGTSDQGKGLFCMDWETGKILSTNKDIKSANLLVADGMIYSYEDRSGKISLLKPNENSIELVSSFKVKTGKGPNLAHMSIANGMLFVRHGKHLMAYNVKQN